MSYVDYKIPLPVSKINSELEVLRKEIKYLNNIFVEDNYMRYKVKSGTAKWHCEHVNKLIEELGLDLIAIPTYLTADDSFVVKFKSSSNLV